MSLGDILLFPILGPIKGFIWLLEQIEEKALEEMYDPETLRAELIQLRIGFERGDIPEEVYKRKAEELWGRLRTLATENLEGDENGSSTD